LSINKRLTSIFSQQFFDKKLSYIHLNPVCAGLVEKEEEYLYSSYGDVYGGISCAGGLEDYKSSLSVLRHALQNILKSEV
jgi:hypothetical protein